MPKTNIKNLPQNAHYFTEQGTIDKLPWVEISRTENQVQVAEVVVKADPQWQPEKKGNFVTNSNKQTWLFDKIGERVLLLRKTKLGWSRRGMKFTENRALRVHDFNY